jgi:RNA polymerase sigma-70 factor (ECF subfamily)
MQGVDHMSQQAAWQALLALRPRLRRFACGLTGSLDEADDLVQAVYERAIERHWQWEPGTRLHSWMFKIAHSLWVSRRRHAAVRAGRGDPVDPDSLVGSDGERTVQARLTLDDVRRLVARLPAEQRESLMLVAVDGVSYADAADILGIPAGTVASRVARARLALVDALEGVDVAMPTAAAARARSG